MGCSLLSNQTVTHLTCPECAKYFGDIEENGNKRLLINHLFKEHLGQMTVRREC